MGTETKPRLITAKDILTYTGTILALATAFLSWNDSMLKVKEAEMKVAVERDRSDVSYEILVKAINDMREDLHGMDKTTAVLEIRLDHIVEDLKNVRRKSSRPAPTETAVMNLIEEPPEPAPPVKKLSPLRPPVDQNRINQLVRETAD